MAKTDKNKSDKEASDLFHNIMGASVKGNPKPIKNINMYGYRFFDGYGRFENIDYPKILDYEGAMELIKNQPKINLYSLQGLEIWLTEKIGEGNYIPIKVLSPAN